MAANYTRGITTQTVSGMAKELRRYDRLISQAETAEEKQALAAKRKWLADLHASLSGNK